MTYEVRTPVFEGPLDLLLQLITSHRLEVTELSLGDLVSEYLEYLDVMRSLDLEVTSEFLVIAATLIQLKARSLLPGADDVDLDEELLLSEERDRLLSRLLANLTFKDVAAVISHRLDGSALFVPRDAGFDPDTEPPPRSVRIGADAHQLAVIAGRVLTAKLAEPDLDHLDLDLPSVTDAMRTIRSRLEREIETDFEEITKDASRPMDVIAYFLAVLELARWGMLRARQDDHTGPITLTHKEVEGSDAIVSEFDPTGGAHG